MFFLQEDTSSQRIVDQQDPSSLVTTEVAALPSPTPQALEQKEQDSKRETVDEEWPKALQFGSAIWLLIKWNRKTRSVSSTHVRPPGPLTPEKIKGEKGAEVSLMV